MTSGQYGPPPEIAQIRNMTTITQAEMPPWTASFSRRPSRPSVACGRIQTKLIGTRPANQTQAGQ